jgi:CheY-like chemotaxis protein
MFEPFFTTKELGKGTGLGLASAKAVVEQAGGTIAVESPRGGGTVFVIRLPRVPLPPSRAKGAERRTPPPRAAERETVLLVDDDVAILRPLARRLAQCGYETLEATGAGDALAVCERHEGPIHLLVTDVVMKYMNGVELSNRIASFRPDTRTLLMSGYVDDDVLASIPASTPFIEKPFTAEQLLAKVREVLAARTLSSRAR